MRIISSEITEQIAQIDGRISVTESHIYDSGTVQLHSYLAEATWDLQTIANQRAANINAAIEQKEQEQLAANNFEVPITRSDFLDKIPQPRRIQLRTLAKTDAGLEDALAYLDSKDEIFKSKTEIWLNKLVTAGILTADEVASILTGW